MFTPWLQIQATSVYLIVRLRFLLTLGDVSLRHILCFSQGGGILFAQLY